jgi:HK97 family phage portal protein
MVREKPIRWRISVLAFLFYPAEEIMNFFSKIRAVFSQGFDKYIEDYLKGDDVHPLGTVVSNDSAMKYSALFACFRVLAETFASVPIFEYKKIDDYDRERSNDTGLYDLLHNAPNDEMSAYNFKEAMMYQLCAGGNAIARKLMGGYGGIVGLYPFEWQRVIIERDKSTRKLLYKYDLGNENKGSLTRDEVLHIPGPSMGGIIGMSIIEYATSAIRLGITYERTGQKYFENMAAPSGIFKHPSTLKDQAYERLKKDLNERYQLMQNKGMPILAEDGLDFTPFEIKLIDAQMIESKKLQIEDICRFCRVPLHLVQNLDRATNNNIEHQSLEFVMYTMLPHFKRAEECINTQLLTKNQRDDGYYFEFNLNSLLRGDAKTTAEAFSAARQGGWMSVNDIRRLLNMNSIPNGNIYLQPMNMIEAGKELPEKKKIDEKIREEIDILLNQSVSH